MDTQVSAMQADSNSLGENVWIVLFAYYIMLGWAMWTVISGTYFIRSEWVSVGKARELGEMHMSATLIPICLMSAYIYFQRQDGDYKEMCAALLAGTFALLEFMRTIFIMWRLESFIQWSIAFMKSMESHGYKASVQEECRIGRFASLYRGPASQADNLLVNDSIICHGFGMQLLSRHELDIVNGEQLPMIKRKCLKIWYSLLGLIRLLILVPISCVLVQCLRPRNYFPKMLFPNAETTFPTAIYVKAERYFAAWRFPGAETGQHLFPLHPEMVWIRWTTLLVAQTDWMRELDDAALPADPLPTADYVDHCRNFAEQILISAALHSRHSRPSEGSTPPAALPFPISIIIARLHSRHSGPSEGSSPSAALPFPFSVISASLHFLYSTPSEGSSLPAVLPFSDWKRYPGLRRGKLSKQEFLKDALQRGSGLPYNMPHKMETQKDGVMRYGYEKFADELCAAKEALPRQFSARMESFSLDMLEWFAILLSVENWGPVPEIKDRFESGSTVRPPARQSESDNAGSNSHVEPVREIERGEGDHSGRNSQDTPDHDAEEGGESDHAEHNPRDENDIPIENLRKQLGFSDFAISRFKFPLLGNVDKTTLWGNRNVLEISCHVDNWIALFDGQNSSPSAEENALVDSMSDWYSTNFDFHVSNSLSQMLTARPEEGRFAKSMTFLGCSMEMLRSSLAKWTQNTGQVSESTWKIHLGAEEGIARELRVSFDISDDLMAFLCNLESKSDLEERHVQMRVLWELQNHFHNSLPDCGVGASRLQAMILCVLSFPGLSMEVMEEKETSSRSEIFSPSETSTRSGEHSVIELEQNADDPFNIGHYVYLIRATSGPQNVHVRVSFNTRMSFNTKISVELVQEIEFCWQTWRDSFYGHLAASRLCQKKLGIANFPLLQTTANIWTGIEKVQIRGAGTGTEMNVWKGWLPPRANICQYEIATSGFIMQYRTGRSDDIQVRCGENRSITCFLTLKVPREIWDSVAYGVANPLSLKNAALVGQELLQSVADGEKDKENWIVDSVDRARKLREDENRARSRANNGLSLLLLEFAAIERDTRALRQLMRLFMENGCGKDSIMRCVRLLERFFLYGGDGSDSTTSTGSYLRRVCGDKERVVAVATLFKNLLHNSKYDHFVCERYARFLLMLSYGTFSQPLNSDCMNELRSLIVRRSEVENSE